MGNGSNESNQRPSNARLALWILTGMLALAALAVVFTLLTKDYRRGGDALKPDLPGFGQSMLVSLGIFAIVAGVIGLLLARFNRPR